MHRNCLFGIGLEVIACIEKVVDDHQLCSSLDLLHLGSIEQTLKGPFDLKATSIDIFLRDCQLKFEVFAQKVYGVGAYAPSIVLKVL